MIIYMLVTALGSNTRHSLATAASTSVPLHTPPVRERSSSCRYSPVSSVSAVAVAPPVSPCLSVSHLSVGRQVVRSLCVAPSGLDVLGSGAVC